MPPLNSPTYPRIKLRSCQTEDLRATTNSIRTSCPSDGPCALDYSKMKTPDGRWSDPSADELVQRHRIHSGLSLRRRQVCFDKPQLGSTSPAVEEFLVAPSLAREHVESLHQNASANMLFGKNNVEVQPVSCHCLMLEI